MRIIVGAPMRIIVGTRMPAHGGTLHVMGRRIIRP
jgi:hypothetical protein